MTTQAADIVIVSGARTPMGGLQGSLSSLSAPELASVAIRSTLEKAGVAPELVEEVIMGCVLPAGLKQGPARQAALDAGIPANSGATTINKLCGSGMKAAMLAASSSPLSMVMPGISKTLRWSRIITVPPKGIISSSGVMTA